jgi:hypothetical protein
MIVAGTQNGDPTTPVANAGSARRTVRPVSYVAIAISVLVSAGVWWTMAVGGDPNKYNALPAVVRDNLSYLILVLILGIVVGIILNMIGGSFGGANRVMCVIGGLALLSPGLTFAVWAIASLLTSPNG